MSSLNTILKLTDINTREDIKPLSYAMFPGTHCPLFGVTMIASFIEDLVVVVLGTQECTYYSKDFAYLRQKGKDNFYSLVVNKHDITFGCEEKIKEAIKYIDMNMKPKAIMMVTTCVLEVIGEDTEGIKNLLQDDINAKLLVVKTEHFKCNNHIVGMEDALEELIVLMEPQQKEKGSINILGHRQHDIEKTELFKILKDENIKINTIIPSESSIESLEIAPRGELNLVTDFVALPLAREMEKKFDIPFIYFDKYLSMERIKEGYTKIQNVLDINISDRLKAKEKELELMIEEAREKLSGKTFMYGNTPMNAFEVSSFLSSIGIEPIVIQARDLYENDKIYIEEIRARNYNPYVTKIANISPLRKLYDEFKPDFYIGHENPMELARRGIVQVTLDEATKGLGYEVCMTSIKKILLCLEQSKSMGGIKHGAI
ncbi:nitrogenase iron-molybdenum cofactor biosynthesis protein NifE [Gottschalkia acidurici 9a]|uniref:Nitrogenase iron-molybdenum cofactor biosynthesis protein NifE n=1 Tax=Gottschalkia acidurici (strain ATCC 7906 / DSM 604 / BCRC 14475 / CIP 104303 / KCTC 5404 / NCIMB 10678 / 9a) TaxID=1128398 RepID=K0AXF4_GOTA9|nr:nitrogenase component 1 [Gottschalkia acidurici]AFS77447.1 nitrogenase iron-molybdenum cofactor biosynthesis protein NifE [Gottschalkia acidurici 9a]